MTTTHLMTALALALGLSVAGCKGGDRTDSAGKTVEPGDVKPGDLAPRTDDSVRAQPIAPVAGDNTAVNQRDRNDSARTADNADLDQASVDTMAKIRQSIIDADLSDRADNVKIIVSNGIVTLKGPVATPEEKTAVEQRAAQVVGTANVVSELAVTP